MKRTFREIARESGMDLSKIKQSPEYRVLTAGPFEEDVMPTKPEKPTVVYLRDGGESWVDWILVFKLASAIAVFVLILILFDVDDKRRQELDGAMEVQQQAIERGYAECVDGKFTWKERE